MQTRSQTQDQPPASKASRLRPILESRLTDATRATSNHRTESTPRTNSSECAAPEHEQELHNAPDVDLEYGVEQQPAEGILRILFSAGAHAGPWSAGGHPGFGEADDLTANLGAKKVEHDRILDERVKGSPAEPEGEGKAARRGRLERDEKFDVERAVKQVTGDPVVGK
ncbi:hypothetical protein PDIDSM_58 [Penicillium digitatum]|nr:hypothetical protein PDIDSM_58 [Penicillium digitatum]